MSNFSDMNNVYIMDHPLIQHKISILRNKETGTNEFRKLIEEIAVLMGFEALRDAQKSCFRMISRRGSRVFCERCPQKTPRGTLPVNSNKMISHFP